MAKKELTLVVRARNAVAAGLNAAGKQLRKFGKFAGSIGHGAVKGLKWMAAGFGAIATGISAAMYKAEQFQKQIDQIRTMSTFSAAEASKGVRKLAAEFGLAKEELTKGLYDALSAGIPQDNAFEFLRTAAKMARGGAASTAEAVDLLTTAINAFGIPASKAAALSDLLFTTVRLGKTTIAELAQAFAQVAPLAASSGVKIEQVLASLASMTKQGTRTNIATTQLRGAIVALNKILGDGWSKTMTLQQGMEELSRRAGGSSTKMQEMGTTIEGVMAITSLTGAKARAAAADISEFAKAGGEADKAFEKVAGSNALGKFSAAINNVVLVAGKTALKMLGPTIERAATAAAGFAERIADWAETSQTIANIRSTIDGIINALAKGGESRGQALDAMLDVIKAGFSVAAENAVDVLKRAAGEIGGLIADGFKKLIKKTPYTKAEIDAAAGQIGLKRGNSISERLQGRIAIRKRDWAGFSGDQEKAIKEQIKRNRLKADGAVVSENLTVAENKLALAIKRLQKIAKDHAPAPFVGPPEPPSTTPEPPSTTPAVVAEPDEDAQDKAAEDAQDKAAEELAVAKETHDKLLAEKEALEDEYTAAEKAALEDRWQAQKAAAEKELALAEELAAKKINAFIQENKDKEKGDKQAARDAERDGKRAAILEDRLRKGGRLSKQQQEWLDAFNAIQGAQKQLQPLRDQIKVAEDNLAQLQQTNRTLAEIQKGLDRNHVALNALMQLG